MSAEPHLNKKPIYIGSGPDETNSWKSFIYDFIYCPYPSSIDVNTFYQESLNQLLNAVPVQTLKSNPKMITTSSPIRSLKELMRWRPNVDPINISTTPLRTRSSIKKQKLIHCHDMMGGYINHSDSQSLGGSRLHCYNFRFWQYIDIFVYFSHYRVTIPPPGWIEAAHSNGVKVLGNFITEWEEGELELIKLLDGPDASFDKDASDQPLYTKYADLLVELASHYKFDGWFINIESKLPNARYAIKLKNFVKYLTEKMHHSQSESLVIWYDSIIDTGELKWQNELNESNKMFFDVCDGMFLNYFWKPDHLERSMHMAGDSRRYDVYAGVDVWGRGTFGGGMFNSIKAIQEAFCNHLSMGLFAPAWTLESVAHHRVDDSDGSDRRVMQSFIDNENLFWHGKHFSELVIAEGQPTLEGWEVKSGGDGWKIEGDEFVSSYEECVLSRLVHVREFDQLLINVWYKGTAPNFLDSFRSIVRLNDKDNSIIQVIDSEELTASEGWKNICNILNLPSSGFSVEWCLLAHDVEKWKGHYGTRIKGASVVGYNFDSKLPCIHDVIKSYDAVYDSCFCTCFNVGMGYCYSVNGVKVSNKPWNNMRLQQPLPNKILPRSHDLYIQLSNDHNSFNGGSCLYIKGVTKSVIPLFDLKMIMSSETMVYLTVKDLNENCNAHLALSLTDYNGVVHNVLVEHFVHQMDDEGWITNVYKLSNYNNHILTQISLTCGGEDSYEFCVGQIKICALEGAPRVEPVEDLRYECTWNSKSLDDGDVNFTDVNLYWKAPKQKHYYRIYRDGCFIAECASNCYLYEDVSDASCVFVVQPVLEATLEVGDKYQLNVFAI
ncbi:hypothetical protein AKO1_008157 [Acrasis kona]|uniref:FBA domain-containing protein n=1 Tax=Acrasis kona TaxID=1008807 RepID=A0AAW2YNA3_9EUKA